MYNAAVYVSRYEADILLLILNRLKSVMCFDNDHHVTFTSSRDAT